MAATIGHVELDLLVRMKGGEPIELGSIEIPVEIAYTPAHMGRIVVDPAQVRASLAAALAEASSALAPAGDKG